MRWTRASGMAALLAALALGLALSLGLWSLWTASAQDTFTVNDDTSPAADGCDAPDFETEDIENAIDSALVANGDTLVICEGTYNPPDAIGVTKSLTIEGRSGADRDDIVVQAAATENGFVISVDGVALRHMKLVGPGSHSGVSIQADADNNTIQDMDITGWDPGVFIGDAAGNVVETSNIHDNDESSIEAFGGAENVIRNNEITTTEVGLRLEDVDRFLVEGNAFSGNTVYQIAIFLRNNVRIQRNQVDTTGTVSDGIHIVGVPSVPAETFVQIGGSPENANTFTGPFGDENNYVDLDCHAENTVDATYNWWGSVARMDIANRIKNDEDDMGVECPAPDDVKGAVVFHPWATGPAPTPTPSPTPSPTATATATATGTPTPTATPGATRTIDLSPPGWHDPVWSGPDATDPGTALACIAGKYSIAYAWEGPTTGFKRHVEGCPVPGICNMAPLNKYDALLVNITADASCVMPVAP